MKTTVQLQNDKKTSELLSAQRRPLTYHYECFD